MKTLALARGMTDVGAGLLALPLADLPVIASVQLLPEWPDVLRVRMQLSKAGGADGVLGLLAWADAVADPVVTGHEHEDYIRLEMSGVVGGLRVGVWTHLDGPDLADTGSFLSLPLDSETHRVPLGALRALARHRQAVSTDA